MSPRVMLGMSFFKNIVAALDTARAFATVDYQDVQVVLGFETESAREDVERDLLQRAGAWTEIWLWDKNCDAPVMERWEQTGLPFPFYAKYSYGGAVNRLHLLAKIARCTQLVRVDPGTWPLDDFASLLETNVLATRNGLIVSGQYDDRIALRDEFVLEQRRGEYYSLIYECTGVDPRPGRQLTGGAAFIVPVGSQPALAFNGPMVWASDDGFFQVIDPTGCRVSPDSSVGRNAPGYPLSWIHYISRLANAVILYECHKGNRDPSRIKSTVRRFLQVLAPLCIPQYGEQIQIFDLSEVPIRETLGGYDNYEDLRKCWPAVVSEIERRLSKFTLKLTQ
jgi:hypothetical protein